MPAGKFHSMHRLKLLILKQMCSYNWRIDKIQQKRDEELIVILVVVVFLWIMIEGRLTKPISMWYWQSPGGRWFESLTNFGQMVGGLIIYFLRAVRRTELIWALGRALYSCVHRPPSFRRRPVSSLVKALAHKKSVIILFFILKRWSLHLDLFPRVSDLIC